MVVKEKIDLTMSGNHMKFKFQSLYSFTEIWLCLFISCLWLVLHQQQKPDSQTISYLLSGHRVRKASRGVWIFFRKALTFSDDCSHFASAPPLFFYAYQSARIKLVFSLKTGLRSELGRPSED